MAEQAKEAARGKPGYGTAVHEGRFGAAAGQCSVHRASSVSGRELCWRAGRHHRAGCMATGPGASIFGTGRTPPRSRGSDRRDGPAGAAGHKAFSERVPRIARLMALALKFEQMIREGVVHNYAVLAAIGQVSRSRLTQVMNLLNLAPDIQEQILFLTWETAEQRGIHERSVRQLSSQLSWTEQRARWQILISDY